MRGILVVHSLRTKVKRAHDLAHNEAPRSECRLFAFATLPHYVTQVCRGRLEPSIGHGEKRGRRGAPGHIWANRKRK